MCNTEITEHRTPTGFVNENIFRLYVPVHHTLRVRVRECLRNIANHAFRVIGRKRAAFCHSLLERPSRHQLHDERESTFAQTSDRVNGDDVGMLQLGDRTCFARESGNRFVIGAGRARMNHFDGHFTTKVSIARTPNDRASAAAQFIQELVFVLEVSDLGFVTFVNHEDSTARAMSACMGGKLQHQVTGLLNGCES